MLRSVSNATWPLIPGRRCSFLARFLFAELLTTWIARVTIIVDIHNTLRCLSETVLNERNTLEIEESDVNLERDVSFGIANFRRLFVLRKADDYGE